MTWLGFDHFTPKSSDSLHRKLRFQKCQNKLPQNLNRIPNVCFYYPMNTM